MNDAVFSSISNITSTDLRRYGERREKPFENFACSRSNSAKLKRNIIEGRKKDARCWRENKIDFHDIYVRISIEFFILPRSHSHQRAYNEDPGVRHSARKPSEEKMWTHDDVDTYQPYIIIILKVTRSIILKCAKTCFFFQHHSSSR